MKIKRKKKRKEEECPTVYLARLLWSCLCGRLYFLFYVGYCFPNLSWFDLVEKTSLAGVCSLIVSNWFTAVLFLQQPVTVVVAFTTWDSLRSPFASTHYHLIWPLERRDLFMIILKSLMKLLPAIYYYYFYIYAVYIYFFWGFVVGLATLLLYDPL